MPITELKTVVALAAIGALASCNNSVIIKPPLKQSGIFSVDNALGEVCGKSQNAREAVNIPESVNMLAIQDVTTMMLSEGKNWVPMYGAGNITLVREAAGEEIYSITDPNDFRRLWIMSIDHRAQPLETKISGDCRRVTFRGIFRGLRAAS